MQERKVNPHISIKGIALADLKDYLKTHKKDIADGRNDFINLRTVYRFYIGELKK